MKVCFSNPQIYKPRFAGDLELLEQLGNSIYPRPDSLHLEKYVSPQGSEREQTEQKLLAQLLDQTHHQPLLLLGNPGTGKSVLINKLQHDLMQQGVATHPLMAKLTLSDRADLNEFLNKLSGPKPKVIIWDEFINGVHFDEDYQVFLQLIQNPQVKLLCVTPGDCYARLKSINFDRKKDLDRVFLDRGKKDFISVLHKPGKRDALEMINSALKLAGFPEIPQDLTQKILDQTVRRKLPQRVSDYLIKIATLIQNSCTSEQIEQGKIPINLYCQAFEK